MEEKFELTVNGEQKEYTIEEVQELINELEQAKDDLRDERDALRVRESGNESLHNQELADLKAKLDDARSDKDKWFGWYYEKDAELKAVKADLELVKTIVERLTK